VMSVMNGFRTELIDKIVGFNAHAVVKSYNKTLVEISDKDFSKSIFSNDGEAVIFYENSTKGIFLKGYFFFSHTKLHPQLQSIIHSLMG